MFIQGLDKSSSSDRFGLNSSTSSTGLGGLDDLVSKIVEDDDQSLFAYNGLSDNVGSRSDVYSFDR